LYGLFDALKLFFKIAVDELPNRTGGIQDHEAFRKYFIKLVNESVTARGGDVTNPCAPSVHFSYLLLIPLFRSERSNRSTCSSQRRNAAAITGERLGAELAKPCF
jgi:hypothetical protein